MGLSMSHNSPAGTKRATTYRRVAQAAETDRPQPIMTLAVGGSILKLKAAKVPRGPRPTVRRGKITQFTAQSRGRLLETLASLNQPALPFLPLMCTLTYPAVFPSEGGAVKRHLDMFLKRLKRAYPYCAAIWKLEYQKRGAPHFHILLFGVPFIDRHWVARAWAGVVASDDERHITACSRIERIRSWRGVMFYASKYVAKVEVGESQDGCGRFWGVSGREHLPIEIITCALTFAAFYRARRVAKRMLVGKQRCRVVKGGATEEGKPTRSPTYVPRLTCEAQGLKVFADFGSLAQLARCFT